MVLGVFEVYSGDGEGCFASSFCCADVGFYLGVVFAGDDEV